MEARPLIGGFASALWGVFGVVLVDEFVLVEDDCGNW